MPFYGILWHGFKIFHYHWFLDQVEKQVETASRKDLFALRIIKVLASAVSCFTFRVFRLASYFAVVLGLTQKIHEMLNTVSDNSYFRDSSIKSLPLLRNSFKVIFGSSFRGWDFREFFSVKYTENKNKRQAVGLNQWRNTDTVIDWQ